MASNLFKTRYLPNPDGTDSTTALTDANTVFVHTYLGDDSTGDGTRSKPYRSMSKANLKAGVTYVLFRGVINEAFTTEKIIVGDDINQVIIFSNYSVDIRFGSIQNLTSDKSHTHDNPSVISRILAKDNTDVFLYVGSLGGSILFCLYGYLTTASVGAASIKNSIISKLKLGNTSSENIITNTNNIIDKYIDILATSGNRVNYTVLLASTIFKYNSINIIQPSWTNNSKANMGLFKSSYIAAGMTQTNLDLLFSKDTFGNETSSIIKEQRAGGSHPNVFNKYAETLTGTLVGAITQNQAKTSIQLTVADSSKFPSTGDVFIPFTGTYTNNGASITDGFEVFTYTSVTINSSTSITFIGASYTFKMAYANGITCTRYGDVLDFTLNPDPTNEALWASDTGGYVGCFRPAVDGIINQSASVIDVNADGSDTANAGNLIQVDASGNLVFSTLSTQLWNRFRDVNCVEILLGSKFKGLNAMSNDGSPFGTYIGKKQNLIDAAIVNPGDELAVGTMYKVFNDSAQDVTKAIIYNSVQYLPEYTFMCIAGATTFSLLNAGSGTYVKKVNADVLESIEILPYDNATTPSAFPKFSAPLMGECKLLYYTAAGATRYGKTAGNPVLFGDLANANMITDFGIVNDKMSYYDGYAVSNADQEFFTLANPSLTSPKSTYFTAAIPTLRFLKREINAHFDLPYDY